MMCRAWLQGQGGVGVAVICVSAGTAQVTSTHEGLLRQSASVGA